jgi:hypothetical protein
VLIGIQTKDYVRLRRPPPITGVVAGNLGAKER